MNCDQRAALPCKTREIRRTRHRERTEQNQPTRSGVPANARGTTCAGGTATGDCSFTWLKSIHGEFHHTIQAIEQEVGWRRRVDFSVSPEATRAHMHIDRAVLMTRVGTHAFKTARQRSPARRHTDRITSLRASKAPWMELDVAAIPYVLLLPVPKQRSVRPP